MKCLHCEKKLKEDNYRFCVTCLLVLKQKYALEAITMTDIDFEEWLYETNETQREADRYYREIQD